MLHQTFARPNLAPRGPAPSDPGRRFVAGVQTRDPVGVRL